MENRETILLARLLGQAPFSWEYHGKDILLSGVAMDSRQVKAGQAFVAIQGQYTDGHKYIPQALQNGAKVVFGAQPLSDRSVPYVRVSDARLALAYLAAAFQGFPTRKLVMIGVTGTDGKTTTANMIYEILKSAGYLVGLISTVNAVIGEQSFDTGFHVTTPEATDVQRYLATMVASGATHVILEATSHGLAQKRLAGCEFDMAVLTNISHEHLDYHHTFEDYRASKAQLFAGLQAGSAKHSQHSRAAVLNRDDASFSYFQGITKTPIISYGFQSAADIVFAGYNIGEGNTQFFVTGVDLEKKKFNMEATLPLLGEYNLYNALAAIALTRGVMGISTNAIQKGLSSMQSIPGRMERIDLGQDFLAIVDFAHTPNALKRALQSARKLTEGRLIAVFGSAGLRDREKRRMMAEVSAELADLTILTAEDPRSESLDQILKEMAKGMGSKSLREGEHYWRIPDRREAIRFAIRLAQPGDLVILCGKGHEQSMCFGSTEYAWDDCTALRAALAELLEISTLERMPYLPDPKDYLDILP